MTYSPPKYAPAQEVERMHNSYRWTGKNAFSPFDTQYWWGVGTIPTILGIVGFVLFISWCCAQAACGCKATDDAGKARRARTCRLVLLLTCIALAIPPIVGHVGNAAVGSALDEIVNGIDGVRALLHSLNGEATQLSETVSSAQTSIDNFSLACPALASQTSAMKQTIQAVAQPVQQITTFTKDLETGLQVGEDKAHTYNGYRTIGTDVVFILIHVVAVLFFIAAAVAIFGKSFMPPSGAIAPSILATLLYIVLGIELYLSVAGSDYCMDPTQNAISAIKGFPAGAAPQQVVDNVQFYLTCIGNSTLDSTITDAENNVNKSRGDVVQLQQSATVACPTNGTWANDLTALEQSIGNLTQILEDCRNLVGCKPINEIYQDVVPLAFCTDTVPAVVQLWAATLASALLLKVIAFAVQQGGTVVPDAVHRPDKQRLYDSDEEMH
eukprot:TRINITY_DN3430_c0_g1_i1.p1 TRINITY_DN3430_c0_g1~~TRINITY_DN3430_c0_g1_i1.p1  ORF type:complete len:440 (-),score=77.99 TRINITY_DN3430_c0_g1_i1:66-1385(-)